jgi:hypothetical protein
MVEDGNDVDGRDVGASDVVLRSVSSDKGAGVSLAAVADVVVINLTPHGIDCHVCDEEDNAGHGIPIYEDVIVPDDYTGEWGGVPVCLRCYYVVRGIQSENPGKCVSINTVRRLVRRTC